MKPQASFYDQVGLGFYKLPTDVALLAGICGILLSGFSGGAA
jgi:hypothetical protein